MQTRRRDRKTHHLPAPFVGAALVSMVATCSPFSSTDPEASDAGVAADARPTADAGADGAISPDGAPGGFRCAPSASTLFCADFEDETWRDATAGFQTLPQKVTATTPVRPDGRGRALLLAGTASGQIDGWAIRPLGKLACASAGCRMSFAFQLRRGSLAGAMIGSVWRTDGGGQQIRGVRIEGSQLHWVVDYTSQPSPTIAMNDAWRRVRIELDPAKSSSTAWIDDVELASTTYTPARTYTDVRIGIVLNGAFTDVELLFDDVLVESL